MKHLFLVWSVALCHRYICHAASSQQQQSSSYNTRKAPRRERNLDHWDADTLAFYLGVDEGTGKILPHHQYPGHDAAVMFYAQWCQNCHTLAPTWDAIATHLHAGSHQSKLIMALFDCELNQRHMKLCTIAGVQHYPTLMFLGDGVYRDTDVVTRTLLGKKRSAGPAGPSPIPHSIKFQGQWQYADAVLDWIRLMQGFSSWHRFASHGMFRYIRNGLLGFLRPKPLGRKTPQSLPVGIPVGNNEAQALLLDKKLEQTKEDSKLMEKAAAHAGLLLDSMLFPNKTADVFATLTESGAWNSTSKNPVHQVMRACTLELSLDYCSRLSTHVTNDYIDELSNITEIPSMKEIEALLKDRITQQEPFCDIFDLCLQENFASAKCRPPQCPFQDAGCRYASACLDSAIEKEYAVALEIIAEGEEFPPKPKYTAVPTKKYAWGI
jgi:thiol-disulfide isomerase/thioredoxin